MRLIDANITNADYIRNMSDEEMANYICNNALCGACPFYECDDIFFEFHCTAKSGHEKETLLNWLRQPHVTDTNVGCKEEKTMKRDEILKAAEQIVCTDREKQYGSPENNFALIARLWSVTTGYTFDAHMVAVMMAQLKIARIISGQRKDDNYIDLAGYAACAAELAEGGTENVE